jgi:hypothetical protein
LAFWPFEWKSGERVGWVSLLSGLPNFVVYSHFTWIAFRLLLITGIVLWLCQRWLPWSCWLVVVGFTGLWSLHVETTYNTAHIFNMANMLLATKNPVIEVDESAARVDVRYRDREWVFPRGDCILLPIENTTAELLARYIAGRLLNTLKSKEGFLPEVLRVEVEEAPGQSATVECRPS